MAQTKYRFASRYSLSALLPVVLLVIVSFVTAGCNMVSEAEPLSQMQVNTVSNGGRVPSVNIITTPVDAAADDNVVTEVAENDRMVASSEDNSDDDALAGDALASESGDDCQTVDSSDSDASATMVRRTRHDVTANIDYAAKTVEVVQKLRYTNQTGQVLDHILLNVEANNFSGAFELVSVSFEGEKLPADSIMLEGNRLRIDLPSLLGRECNLSLDLAFQRDAAPASVLASSRRGGSSVTATVSSISVTGYRLWHRF